jgi:hypothetical protein
MSETARFGQKTQGILGIKWNSKIPKQFKVLVY